MKEKKTIGFDILDNAGLNEIDKIGTDIDMLDEKTKKRILEMTRKRYNDAIKGENTGIYDNAEDVVDNVEVYSRKKSSKIIMSVVNTAAALGLAVGSVFLVKNLGRGDNDIPDDPLLPSESTTFSTESTNSKENLSQEEIARNKRIEDFIRYVYVSHNTVLDKERFGETLKIEYAYLDINNDSVDELLIRYDFLNHYYFGLELNYFDGTEYIPFDDIQYASKFDLQNRKLYELYDGYEYEGFENEFYMDVKTWENTEISCDVDFFTYQESYHDYMTEGELFYTHNGEQCTEEELQTAKAEYENCDNAGLKFIPYIPDDSFFKGNSVNNTLNGQSAEENARNKRLEYEVQATFECYEKNIVDLSIDDLKIDYAYLDINNDLVDELFVRSKVLDVPESESTTIYFFNGTEYIAFYRIVADEFKFDLQNRKYYEILKENDDDTDYCILRIRTWENVEFSDGNQDYLTYFTPQDNYEGGQFYLHDDNRCTKEEYDKAMAEYENCDSAELNFIPYNVKKSEAAVNGQSAEENARNKRIEDYIEYLYYYCDGGPDKDKFYDTIKIDYAYLDINNDSVDELFIRFHNLNDYTSYYEGTEINYFDGTKYVPIGEMNTTFKFDLQNRKLYQLSESHEGGYSLYIRTWENVEFSADTDFASFQDYYQSNVVNYEQLEYSYEHNDEPCTKEEYEKVMDEYENCNSAELNFMPYTVKIESAEETEITLTFSNGKKPDGEVPIIFDLPAKANGRFVIAFMVQKEDGTTEIQESGTFYCPEYCQLTQNVIGSGENVNVTAIITNLSNNKRATIGTYSFNFAEGRYTCLSGGDPYTAFEDIGAFPETETEAPPPPKYGA